MDLSLSEEHEALRATVEDFARKEVAPVIGDLYEREEFPYEIVAKMGAMGLFGLPVSEEYGGMGGDYFALCLALEELARVDSSVAITLEAGVSLGAMPIYRFGTDEQKRSGSRPWPRGRSWARSGSPSPAAAPTPAPPAPPRSSTATSG
jgi:short/branched chain acyl-CoA dehydrogenase